MILVNPDLKKAIFDLNLEKETIPEILFRHRKTQQACHIFLSWLKAKSEATPSEISAFARALEASKIDPLFKYSKKSLYASVIRRLRSLGLVGLEIRFDEKSKKRYRRVYTLIWQAIPSKAPQKMGSWNRFSWEFSRRWNEFLVK